MLGYRPAAHVNDVALEQLWEEATQYIPVNAVQSALPHRQATSAGLIDSPYVLSQLVGGRSRQVRSSFSTVDAYLLEGHVLHDVTLENGSSKGWVM